MDMKIINKPLGCEASYSWNLSKALAQFHDDSRVKSVAWSIEKAVSLNQSNSFCSKDWTTDGLRIIF